MTTCRKEKKHYMVDEEFVAPTKCFHLTYILSKSNIDTIENMYFLKYFSRLCLHFKLMKSNNIFFSLQLSYFYSPINILPAN